MEEIQILFATDYDVSRYGSSRREFPPIGLLYLAASLEQAGIKVVLTDICSRDFDIHEIKPHKIIGLSINASYSFPHFIKYAEAIKEKAEILVAGGQHVTAFPELSIRLLSLDYAILGEGEIIFPKLLKALYAGDVTAILNEKGIAYKAGNEIIGNGRSERIKNLDLLPFPARHLLDDAYIILDRRIDDEQSICMITSRGCPKGCNFCGNVYKDFRARSAQNVCDEISFIMEAYPSVGGIVFLDENLLFDNRHIEALCRGIGKYKIKWTCNARVDGYDEKIIRLMRRSGCVEIKYGVESGSEDILKRMEKNITIEQAERAIRGTYEAGIRTKCFFLFGYPGDDVSSAQKTIDFLERNKKYIGRINLFSFAPLPNSKSYNFINKDNILKNDWQNFTIYHQLNHWWGTEKEYIEMKRGYDILKEYVDENY